MGRRTKDKNHKIWVTEKTILDKEKKNNKQILLLIS